MERKRNKGLELVELLNSAERCNIQLDDKLYFYLLSKLYPVETAVEDASDFLPKLFGMLNISGGNDNVEDGDNS